MNQWGIRCYEYRVYRRYFRALIPLSNTDCVYSVMDWRWNFLKQQLQENPNYHYNQSLWSNAKRK